VLERLAEHLEPATVPALAGGGRVPGRAHRGEGSRA
jgi:hypothetical protein